MTYRVEIPPEVHAQIDAQVAYLRDEHVAEFTMADWLLGVYDGITGLREHPARFPIDEIRTQIRGYEIRRLNYGEFAVFYRIDDDRRVVQILTIRHGKRQPWLEEENI